MKHNSRISTVSILGVLCLCITGGAAHAAASVRALGGSGTYAGTASAGGATSTTTAASNTSAASRAGSVRVTPTSNKTSTSASVSTGNTSAARGAATSRLSVGKYLGSAITTGGKPLRPNISNGGNVNNGDTIVSGDVEKIVNSLLDEKIGDIRDSLKNKQGILSSKDGLVDVDDNNEIFINVDNLANALSGKVGGDVGAIDIKVSNDGQNIVWCQAGPDAECTYNHLISVAELTGPKGDPGESVDMEKLETLLNEKILAEIGKLNLKALAYLDTVGAGQINNGAVAWDKLSTDVQSRIQTGGTGELPDNLVTTEKLNDELTPLKTGIDTNTAAIAANTTAITSNTDAISANTTNITTNTTNIAANTTAITAKQDKLTDEQMAVLGSGITAAGVAQITTNKDDIAKKADAADVYTKADVYAKTETYSQEQIDKKLEGITAGGVGPAQDNGDYAWVSLGGKQDWIPIADGTDVVNAGE